MTTKTKAQERREWNDPRSVEFRAAVKGWAFSDADRVKAMVLRAKAYAWLPEHFETLEAMGSKVVKETEA